MIRFIIALLACFIFTHVGHAQYGPDGQVLPGDSYHICFATSFQTSLTTDRSVPPSGFTFGGIEAGSWLCNLAAAQSGLLEWDGIAITWRAVLSDSTANAVDHLNIQGRIYNTNGELLALDSADFFDGQLFVPIGYNEFGTAINSQDDCWCGVTTGGGVSFTTCGDWDLTGVDTVASAATTANVNWLQGSGSLQCGASSARLIAMSPPIEVPGPGDVNCDGVINLLDIEPFVDLLSTGGFDPKADMNFDGNVNLLDIEPFVLAIGG